MTYLEMVKEALRKTQPDESIWSIGVDYTTGWVDAFYDTMYAIGCGETATKEHINNWNMSYADAVEWDANTQGYIDRINRINGLIQSMS